MLLSDEEILAALIDRAKIDKKVLEIMSVDFVHDGDRRVAKAQLKKVIEFLIEHEQDDGIDSLHYFVVNLEDWQSLLKEI